MLIKRGRKGLWGLFFTDGNREQLWCCQYQAIGVRPEMDFFHRSSCTIWSDVAPNTHTCVRRWLLRVVLAGGTKTPPNSWCGATVPPLSPSHEHSTTAPAFPWLHVQADVNRWRGWAWIIWMRAGSTRKGWKLKSLARSRHLYQQHQDHRDVFCHKSVTAALHEVHFLLSWKLFSLFWTYYRALITPQIPTRNTPW